MSHRDCVCLHDYMTSSASTLAPTAHLHRTDYAHTSASGFCTVCGTVWPCAAASRSHTRATLPVPVAR